MEKILARIEKGHFGIVGEDRCGNKFLADSHKSLSEALDAARTEQEEDGNISWEHNSMKAKFYVMDSEGKVYTAK